ncbi:MAG: NADAR family protein [Snowella sp.]|nr:NADAR family protein [Snowella sp.]
MITAVKTPEFRTYNRQECITFRKTAERFGGLSNMAGGYLLNVNGIKILTSEALYQTCRFPHLPEVQQLIIAERSPMTAKMRSKPYRDNSRPDWDLVRTRIMRWCLRVKLVQNWNKFSKLLLDTRDLPIVEDSRKDDFWGAKPDDEEILTGANVLGRLLMQLREQLRHGEISRQAIIEPLDIPDFLLYGQPIPPISGELPLANYTSILDFNKLVDQPISEEFSSDVSKNELDLHVRNIDSLQENLTEVKKSKQSQYDTFQIMLPYIIESLLNSEHTDKELAELFEIPLKLMRSWLNRATKLGKIKKLSKPVRYVSESQLLLFN